MILIVLSTVGGIALILAGTNLLLKDIKKSSGKWADIALDVLFIVLGIGFLVSSHFQSRANGSMGIIEPEDLPPVVLRMVVQESTLSGQNVVVLEDTVRGRLYCVKTTSVLSSDLLYVKRWKPINLDWTIVSADYKLTSIDDISIPE